MLRIKKLKPYQQNIIVYGLMISIIAMVALTGFMVGTPIAYTLSIVTGFGAMATFIIKKQAIIARIDSILDSISKLFFGVKKAQIDEENKPPVRKMGKKVLEPNPNPNPNPKPIDGKNPNPIEDNKDNKDNPDQQDEDLLPENKRALDKDGYPIDVDFELQQKDRLMKFALESLQEMPVTNGLDVDTLNNIAKILTEDPESFDQLCNEENVTQILIGLNKQPAVLPRVQPVINVENLADIHYNQYKEAIDEHLGLGNHQGNIQVPLDQMNKNVQLSDQLMNKFLKEYEAIPDHDKEIFVNFKIDNLANDIIGELELAPVQLQRAPEPGVNQPLNFEEIPGIFADEFIAPHIDLKEETLKALKCIGLSEENLEKVSQHFDLIYNSENALKNLSKGSSFHMFDEDDSVVKFSNATQNQIEDLEKFDMSARITLSDILNQKIKDADETTDSLMILVSSFICELNDARNIEEYIAGINAIKGNEVVEEPKPAVDGVLENQLATRNRLIQEKFAEGHLSQENVDFLKKVDLNGPEVGQLLDRQNMQLSVLNHQNAAVILNLLGIKVLKEDHLDALLLPIKEREIVVNPDDDKPAVVEPKPAKNEVPARNKAQVKPIKFSGPVVQSDEQKLERLLRNRTQLLAPLKNRGVLTDESLQEFQSEIEKLETTELKLDAIKKQLAKIEQLIKENPVKVENNQDITKDVLTEPAQKPKPTA